MSITSRSGDTVSSCSNRSSPLVVTTTSNPCSLRSQASVPTRTSSSSTTSIRALAIGEQLAEALPLDVPAAQDGHGLPDGANETLAQRGHGDRPARLDDQLHPVE